MLTKGLRLQKNKEFAYIYRRGSKTRGKYFSIYALHGSREMKIGISISKKVGNAVVRNLYKRRLQHLFREVLGTMKVNKYVVVVNPYIKKATFQDLRADVIETAKKFIPDYKGEK